MRLRGVVVEEGREYEREEVSNMRVGQNEGGAPQLGMGNLTQTVQEPAPAVYNEEEANHLGVVDQNRAPQDPTEMQNNLLDMPVDHNVEILIPIEVVGITGTRQWTTDDESDSEYEGYHTVSEATITSEEEYSSSDEATPASEQSGNGWTWGSVVWD